MKKIGLVLAGGGGRGAYHTGVWRALRETGLDRYVAAVSGTSVGGLNAALFLQGNLELAEEIWSHITPQKILTARKGSKKADEQLCYRDEPGGYHDNRYIYSRSGLLEIIDQYLDLDVFDKSSINCYMACKSASRIKDTESYMRMQNGPDGTKVCRTYVNKKAVYFNMRSFTNNDRRKILLATSAIRLLFPKEQIDGSYYTDGGPVDNLPVEPLYRLEHCELIVAVRLDMNGKELVREQFPGARIWEIYPKRELGGVFTGILNFKAEDARRRMRQGYEDSIACCKEIEGIIHSETESLRKWRSAAAAETAAMEKTAALRRQIQNMCNR